MRTLFGTDQLVTEWICVIAFILIPGITAIGTMFASSTKWWEITLMAWFSSVMLLLLCNSAATIFREVQESISLNDELDKRDKIKQAIEAQPPAAAAEGGVGDDNTETANGHWLRIVVNSILRRERAALQGVEHSCFLVQGQAITPIEGADDDEDYYVLKTLSRSVSPYSKLVSSDCLNDLVFTKVYPPERLYSTDEVLGSVPVITRNTWSLEKFFCRPSSTRAVTVVTGPSAVQLRQVRSSLACGILGNLIIILLLVAFCVWMELHKILLVAAVVLVGLYFMVPFIISERQNYAVIKDMESAQNAANNADNEGDDGVYRVSETRRISQPKKWCCWTKFALEISLFFLWPIVYLFVSGSIAVGFVFLFGGFLMVVRYYFSAQTALEELGPIENLPIPSSAKLGKKGHEDGPTRTWRKRARLAEIIKKIGKTGGWGIAILVFVVVYLILVLSATIESTGSTTVDDTPDTTLVTNNLLPDFVYEPQPGQQYPACQMQKGLQLSANTSSNLIDYGFLGWLPYVSGSGNRQMILNGWFGEGVARDRSDIVNDFRAENAIEGSPVSYSLITFPEVPNFGVVCIRGTQSSWDALADAQLWSATILAQVRMIA
jgi:hypothetical protein